MKKAIGFNIGQRGDLIMSTVCARIFKEKYPDYKLVLGFSQRYEDMLPLFLEHMYFDNIHLYDSYDNWPNLSDKQYLEKEKYNIVFHGKPPHKDERWFIARHQTQETCHQHNLPISNNCSCELKKWFSSYSVANEKYIAFAPFGGYSDKLRNPKSLSIHKSQLLVNEIIKMGYKILLLRGSQDPILENCGFLDVNYFHIVRAMLGCRLLIHNDTGIGWVASSYQFPCLGLYSYAYYGNNYVKNIQPINKNAIYLSDKLCDDIPNEEIVKSLKLILK